MKSHVLAYALLICTALYSCSNAESAAQVAKPQAPEKNAADDKLAGKWYYAEAPQSYIEFNGNTCTEQMGEIGASITYTLTWIDSLHYQLQVIQTTGPVDAMFALGDVLQVEIKELTPEYYRFYIQDKAGSHCLFVIRKPGYKGSTGIPC